MDSISFLPLLPFLFFAATIGCVRFGWRVGTRELTRDPEGMRTGTSAIEGSVFGLLGLLIAFTLTGAGDRLNHRRTLIIDEANAIGTAWLRLDLLPLADGDELRTLFRRYVDARLSVAHELRTSTTRTRSERRAAEIGGSIWSRSMASIRAMPDPVAAAPLVEALNAMLDVASTRSIAMRAHPSAVVYLLLAALGLLAGTLIGYGMAGRREPSKLHVGIYGLVISASLYVIVDFEFPRFGIIRVDSSDAAIRDVRRTMGD